MKGIAIKILNHLPKNTLATLVVVFAMGFGRYWYKNWQQEQQWQYTDLKNTIEANHNIMINDNQMLFTKIQNIQDSLQKTNKVVKKLCDKMLIIQEDQDANIKWQLKFIDEFYNGKSETDISPPLNSIPQYIGNDSMKITLKFDNDLLVGESKKRFCSQFFEWLIGD